jgi:pimeloyl-ACP methyl ester carboxylesterase
LIASARNEDGTMPASVPEPHRLHGEPDPSIALDTMLTIPRFTVASILALSVVSSAAQTSQDVVDIPTRPGVTLRMVVLAPPEPKATVVLLPGGHGGLQIYANGSMKWGEGNFLVRTRQLFVEQGLKVAVVDAPSDRQSPPYLAGFRQTPEHVADLKAVIAWLRKTSKTPVWLVGTSRGTQSAAYVATELSGTEGPDGVVLTSTILIDGKSRPVPAMALDRIRIPVLVVHHEQDGCSLCSFSEVPAMMAKLANTPRSQLLSFKGGQNQGDPCEAFAYHGFNGLEPEVVRQVAAWVLAK